MKKLVLAAALATAFAAPAAAQTEPLIGGLAAGGTITSVVITTVTFGIVAVDAASGTS